MLQKHEDRLQISESTALTFASNRACRGLRTQAQIDEKPVPDSKMPVSTGLNYCLLSSRSMVRIHQGASVTERLLSQHHTVVFDDLDHFGSTVQCRSPARGVVCRAFLRADSVVGKGQQETRAAGSHCDHAQH